MITVECQIDNVYPDGTVSTTVEAQVAEPWSDREDWADEVLLPLTGTGRTEGDAGYFLTITRCDEVPELVGEHFEWGV